MTPFNLEAYKKNPDRLRGVYTATVVRSQLVFESCIAVEWSTGFFSLYTNEVDYAQLRLAPLTRKVKCRLWIDTNGFLGGWTSDQNADAEKFALGVYFKHWHGPEWEEEIPAGDV